PGVHKPAERPDRPDDPGGSGVHLIDHRRGRDGVHVRRAAEQAAEPGGDGGAVVVAVAEQVDADGGGDAGEDDDQQQDQRHVVDRAGGGPHPSDEQAAPRQDHDTADDQDCRQGTGGRGEPAVSVLGDADRVGPAFRNQDADNVPGDGREGAVVEDGGAPFEQAPFLQLGGAAGPAELVVAPAPDVADDEDAERQVRQGHPYENLPGAAASHRGVSIPVRYPGGANGSRPTSSAGGPCSQDRRTRAWSLRRRPGSCAQTASMTSAYGDGASRSARSRSSRSAR